MDRSIVKMAKEADDVSAGLQIFFDNIPQRDSGIFESIRELLSLSHGLAELRQDAAQYARLPTPLQSDVQLLLRSMKITLSRVRKMFADTRFVKVSGERPYAQAWYELGVVFKENEGGPPLWTRLEFYSVFLREILSGMRGEHVEPRSVARHRQRLANILSGQQPADASFANGPAVQPPLSPPLPFVGFAPMPGAYWGDEWDNTPFPTAPEPPRPFMAPSPTMSSASYQTQGSSHSSASSVTAPHWATQVFNGRHGSTKFPLALREPSLCFGRPLPRALDRLATEGFFLVSRLTFEADDMDVRFYLRPEFNRTRILISNRVASGKVLTYCIPLTALKLCRKKASIELFRKDRDTGAFEVWAKLNFPDQERIVLFYSIFAALKHSDDVSPAEGLHEDYFHTNRNEEEIKFGGTTTYGQSSIHALRVFYDKWSGGIRIEARPYRGSRKGVPIWTAFITAHVKNPTWLRRAGSRQVELRHLEQHVFAEGYVPTRGRNGRFVLDFKEKTDADDLMRVLRELASV